MVLPGFLAFAASFVLHLNFRTFIPLNGFQRALCLSGPLQEFLHSSCTVVPSISPVIMSNDVSHLRANYTVQSTRTCVTKQRSLRGLMITDSYRVRFHFQILNNIQAACQMLFEANYPICCLTLGSLWNICFLFQQKKHSKLIFVEIMQYLLSCLI